MEWTPENGQYLFTDKDYMKYTEQTAGNSKKELFI